MADEERAGETEGGGVPPSDPEEEKKKEEAKKGAEEARKQEEELKRMAEEEDELAKKAEEDEKKKPAQTPQMQLNVPWRGLAALVVFVVLANMLSNYLMKKDEKDVATGPQTVKVEMIPSQTPPPPQVVKVELVQPQTPPPVWQPKAKDSEVQAPVVSIQPKPKEGPPAEVLPPQPSQPPVVSQPPKAGSQGDALGQELARVQRQLEVTGKDLNKALEAEERAVEAQRQAAAKAKEIEEKTALLVLYTAQLQSASSKRALAIARTEAINSKIAEDAAARVYERVRGGE